MAKLYEISFWIKKDCEPEKVEDKILNIFNDLDFEIVKKLPSKIKNMAYPIQKETIGYFGTIYFQGDPNKIEILDKKVKEISEILRFIILRRKVIKIASEKNQTKETVEKLESALTE